ncbi:hypothetical protein K7X08_033030 [Anisodus acutangulus]|uniref:POT1A/B-like OB fold domain-containing protein n=1 Tax=Anisodus acutangulus TaxID=402998 RepID=A0A9Q1M467_9SOLA|nr:hypothetical protein K7X08_033030 [Anisodus acutangulus]
MDKLPQVLTIGDIIQLSQVVMKTHGPDIYALFNKKEQDKKFIRGLMKWLVDRKIDTGCRIRLTLEDPTARIHAYLYKEDAEQIFDGYPSVFALTRKRNLLLGTSEDHEGSEMDDYFRNPPWISSVNGHMYFDTSADAFASM